MKITSRSPKYGYQGLFILMLLGLVLTAFLFHHRFINILANVFFTLIFILAVYSLSDRKIYFIVTLILALGSGTTSWVYFTTEHHIALFFDVATNVLFFGYMVVLFAIKVFHHEVVDSETIFGALCIYFFVAFFWAFAFYLMDLSEPQSFYLGARSKDITSYMYFSLVTLSTLGYGDITPHTPPAKILSALEAVLGQLYLAVVVARFVGIEIASKRSKAG